jgi:hypothetical protein
MLKNLLTELWRARYHRRASGPPPPPPPLSSLLEQEFYSRDPEFYAGKWQEEEHPRDDDGKFGEGSGQVGTLEPPDENEKGLRKDIRSDGAAVGDATARIVPHPDGHGYAAELGDGESVQTVGDPHDTMADAEDAAVDHLTEQGTLFEGIEQEKKPKRGRPKKKATPVGVSVNADGRMTGATTMDRGEIFADPERFQYKISNIDSETGVTEELKSVKRFNPVFGGQILVWHDTADGKTYVVNGHHRLEVAKRSPLTDVGDVIDGRAATPVEAWGGHMNVMYLDVATAAEARAWGALTNMAEGRGTPTDAADFLRASNYTIEDAESRGVSLKGQVARKAQWLATLPDETFRALKEGRVREGTAIMVGRWIPDGTDGRDTKINSLLNIIRKRESESGEEISDDVVREMAKRKALAPMAKVKVVDLFGERYEEDDLAVEVAELGGKLDKTLKERKNIFNKARQKSTKDVLEGVGENVIAQQHNEAQWEQAQNTQAYLQQQMYLRGAVSDIINQSAIGWKNAESKKEKDRIYDQLQKDILSHINAELGYGAEEVSGERGNEPYRRTDRAMAGTGNVRRHSGGLDMPDREDYASTKNLLSIEFRSRGFGKLLYQKDEEFPEFVAEVPTTEGIAHDLNKEFNSRWLFGDQEPEIEKYDDEDAPEEGGVFFQQVAYRKAVALRRMSEQYSVANTALKVGLGVGLAGWLLGKKARDKRKARLRGEGGGRGYVSLAGPSQNYDAQPSSDDLRMMTRDERKQYAAGDFEETQHPRDEGGKFSSGGGGGGGKFDPKPGGEKLEGPYGGRTPPGALGKPGMDQPVVKGGPLIGGGGFERAGPDLTGGKGKPVGVQGMGWEPEPGKQHLLVGAGDEPSIAKGNTWAESVVPDEGGGGGTEGAYNALIDKVGSLEELDELTNVTTTFEDWSDEHQAAVVGELGHKPTTDEFNSIWQNLSDEYMRAIGKEPQAPEGGDEDESMRLAEEDADRRYVEGMEREERESEREHGESVGTK